MRHLYSSRAAVLRLTGQMQDGSPLLTWGQVLTVVDPLLGTPGEMLCRLDLSFMRPGKDQPSPIAAGRAPDRVGVLIFDAGCDIRAGDRVRCVAGPVTGTFETRAIPDPVIGFADAHHIEVQVIEVSQALVGVFPGSAVEDLA